VKLYGKKFARRAMDQRADRKTETRDAVLWQIDEGNNKCTVKIQGSNQLVVAHFPRNQKEKPYWLKVGNAVRILHRSGVRGYVEVTGEGRAIPTPVEGPVIPDPGDLPDMILTGMVMTATTPETMAIIITSGTYRIDGKVYVYTGSQTGDAVIMNDPAPMTMGIGTNYMGTVLHSFDIDTAPAAGYFRYDLFCIGTDGVVDYIKGTPATTYPAAPAVPTKHLQIGRYILVKGGADKIYQSDIGAKWSITKPTTLSLVQQYPDGFPWSGSTDTPEENITATVRDQYGNAISTSSGGFTIILQKKTGYGQVWSSDTGYADSQVQNTCSGSYTFKYQRNQAVTETTPVLLQATLSSYTGVIGFAIVELLFET